VWQLTVWGDSSRETGEACDDGNTFDGDGWSSTCYIEAGWTWFGGSATIPDNCSEIWGDGVLFSPKEDKWDDGNMQDGDGCSNSCIIEKDWECTYIYGSTSVWTKMEVVPTAVVQAAVGAAMIGSAVASLMSCSSPSGLWQMMNLMQLLMFLLLFGVYLPAPIKNMITSGSFASLSFSIPHLQNLYGIGHLFEFIDFECEDSALASLGAESGSTFVNVLSQIFMLLLIFILHLFALTLMNWDPARANGWWSKWLKWTGKKIFHFFTFTVYIRLLLQFSQFMLMNSISEFYAFNFENTPHIVSLFLAGAIFLVVAAFFVIGVKLWITRVRKWTYHEESRFDEFFSGLKKTKLASAYNLLILMRRAYLVLWIIWMRSMPIMVHLIGATFLQVLHASLIILIRPFQKAKDNIIEVANELIFTMLIAGLIYFNKESAWSNRLTLAYLYISLLINSYRYLMMFPSLLILLISICKCWTTWLFCIFLLF
jgi:cysteine-rich repeat protein